MATQRDHPYSAFNFKVEWGTAASAGFQEVSGLGLEIQMSEYREGSDRSGAPRKIPGLFKVTDVTLKRGVVGSLDLWDWVRQTRDGDAGAARDVTITLLDESRESEAQTWRLLRARPTRYRGPLLSGRGGDVAIEELVLAAEGLEVD